MIDGNPPSLPEFLSTVDGTPVNFAVADVGDEWSDDDLFGDELPDEGVRDATSPADATRARNRAERRKAAKAKRKRKR